MTKKNPSKLHIRKYLINLTVASNGDVEEQKHIAHREDTEQNDRS